MGPAWGESPRACGAAPPCDLHWVCHAPKAKHGAAGPAPPPGGHAREGVARRDGSVNCYNEAHSRISFMRNFNVDRPELIPKLHLDALPTHSLSLATFYRYIRRFLPPSEAVYTIGQRL